MNFKATRLSILTVFYAAILATPLFAVEILSLEARHDALIEKARTEGSDFDAALAKAVEDGMPDSWVLEAEIVSALSSGDMAALLTHPARIAGLEEEFRFGFNRTFISAQQLDGFSDTVNCVAAYQASDWDTFEELAVSSFSKAPAFNKLFGIGDLLARRRIEVVQLAAMEDMAIPMTMKFSSVEGETKTLRDWMGENDAMLVDFWASWCGPCLRLMPQLKEKSADLSAQGVFVAALNTDDRGQLDKANSTRKEKGMETVPWLLDPNGGDLSSLLLIDSIPRMVLFNRDGKILYNGHPSDPALAVALSEIGVTLAAH